jgi:hypothetical protein
VQICTKLILRSERIQLGESKEKSELHDLLFNHFGEGYEKALQPFQKRVALFSSLEVYLEAWDSEDSKNKNQCSELLETLKLTTYSIISICTALMSWSEKCEETTGFMLEEESKGGRGLRTILCQQVPDEYQKARNLSVGEENRSNLTNFFRQPVSPEFSQAHRLKSQFSPKKNTMNVTPDFERAKPNLAVF